MYEIQRGTTSIIQVVIGDTIITWFIHDRWIPLIGAIASLVIVLPTILLIKLIRYRKLKKSIPLVTPPNNVQGGGLSAMDCFDDEVSDLYAIVDPLIAGVINKYFDSKALKVLPRVINFRTFLTAIAIYERKHLLSLFGSFISNVSVEVTKQTVLTFLASFGVSSATIIVLLATGFKGIALLTLGISIGSGMAAVKYVDCANLITPVPMVRNALTGEMSPYIDMVDSSDTYVTMTGEDKSVSVYIPKDRQIREFNPTPGTDSGSTSVAIKTIDIPVQGIEPVRHGDDRVTRERASQLDQTAERRFPIQSKVTLLEKWE